MSARSRRLGFTQRARQDFRDILVFGEQEWGPLQSERYEQALDNALGTLTDHPALGKPRDDLAVGVSTLLVQHHHVIYRVEEDFVFILRIVHERADLAWALRDQ